MDYIGIDYHKKFSYATVMDEKGKIKRQIKICNDPSTIKEFAKRIPKNAQIAFEASGSWYYFYEQLEKYNSNIHLSHPRKTRLIAEASIKTDKIDSETIAHLLRTNFLPVSYIPEREIRDVREILRYRASLIQMRTQLKNRVRALLAKNGIDIEHSNIFGVKSFEILENLELRRAYKIELAGYLNIARSFNSEIKIIDEEIKDISLNNKLAVLLMGIPGIGHYSSLLILSEIGDVHRFPSARHLCSYAGLVPRVHSSGGKTYHGSITKEGSRWLRWILIEQAHHFRKASSRLEKKYKRLKKKYGGNKAKIAVAREMLKIMFSMLKNKREFKRD